jgi:ATP-dependent Lon protease
MEMEFVVPDQVPVMTLPEVAFFPQALLSLHIFEPRYRQMLADTLASSRLLAVAGLDQQRLNDGGAFEPPHRIATLGIIRACQKSDDGTSNLLLQGLCRAEITEISTDEPYRLIRIRALCSRICEKPGEAKDLRTELARLLALKRDSGGRMPAEMTEFLRTVDDPETFVDLAAFSLCENPTIRQQLLETLDVGARLELFNQHLRTEIEVLRLRDKLQGDLPDDSISDN